MNNALLEDSQSEDTYIFVEINNSKYAFGTNSILEIVKLVQLNCPERLPRHIAGIAEYNSIIINVVDLRSVLSMPTIPYTVDNHIIIIATDEMIFGVVVDDVLDIKKIDRRFIQSAPYHSGITYAHAIYTQEQENVICLSVDSIEKTIKEALEDTASKSACAELLPKDFQSVEILKQRGLQLSKKNTGVSAYTLLKEKDQYMSFFIGDTRYCIKIEHIKSFTKLARQKVTKVPCTPKFISGLLNVKGDCIALIDLKVYLNPEVGVSEIDENCIVIILNAGEFKLGFIVNQIGESVNIPGEDLEKARVDHKGELIDYVQDDQLYYILNIPLMLNNEKLYIR